MARLENGSYDECVAHLEESDGLPMATMTSLTSKAKCLLPNGLSSDIACNYCKEKGHMVKDCEKPKKKKEKDAQKGKPTQRKFTLSVELVARKITLRNDVDEGQVRIFFLGSIAAFAPSSNFQLYAICRKCRILIFGRRCYLFPHFILYIRYIDLSLICDIELYSCHICRNRSSSQVRLALCFVQWGRCPRRLMAQGLYHLARLVR